MRVIECHPRRVRGKYFRSPEIKTVNLQLTIIPFMRCSRIEAISLLRDWQEQGTTIVFGTMSRGGEDLKYVRDGVALSV